MYYLKICNAISEACLDKRYFLKPPTESQIQTYWIESVKKYGGLILIQNKTLEYVNMGQVI